MKFAVNWDTETKDGLVLFRRLQSPQKFRFNSGEKTKFSSGKSYLCLNDMGTLIP